MAHVRFEKMNIRSHIGPAALLSLGTICLAWLWGRLLPALLTPGVFVVMPRYIFVFTSVLICAQGLTVIHKPKAFILPFVLFAFIAITFLSFTPLRFSTSLSWHGYTCGWPMSWLHFTVRSHSGPDITRSLEYNISAGPMIGDLIITTVLAVPIVLISGIKKGKANKQIQDICA